MANNTKSGRPLGIAILAVLAMIGGILVLLSGIAAVAGGSLLTSGIGSIFGALAGVLGGVFIVLGLVELAIGYGFWTGMKWSWWVEMIFLVLGIILSIVALVSGSFGNIVSLIIAAIIVYYLTRPEVKKWFGV